MALINLNDTTPAAPTGFQNNKWQADAPGADRNVSNYHPNIGGVNAQTGTTYTVQASDNGKLITFSNGSAIACSLPDASGFDPQFTFAVTNLGAGTVTITPATSPSTCHIDGAASLVLTTGQGAHIYSDATDYFTERGGGGGAVASSFADNETPSGTVNGSNVTFTLAHTPSPAGSLQLYVNGVLQIAGTDYTLATATITFGSAPSTGALLTAFYRY